MKEDTIRNIVNEVLRTNKRSRDDDFVLCCLVYLRMGHGTRQPKGFFFSYENLDSAPAFETITRIRREIQNQEGRYLASPEAQIKRFKKQTKVHDYYSSKQSSKSMGYSMPNSWMSPD